MTNDDIIFDCIFATAHEAGMAAAKACTPVPMIVQQHASMANDASPVEKEWLVGGGVCGFAWIKVNPANCMFANWCKKNNKGKTDSYEGGLTIWVHEFGQSMERKVAYAGAFACVLCEFGIDASTRSRMD
jgi:hypothetical protein